MRNKLISSLWFVLYKCVHISQNLKKKQYKRFKAIRSIYFVFLFEYEQSATCSLHPVTTKIQGTKNKRKRASEWYGSKEKKKQEAIIEIVMQELISRSMWLCNWSGHRLCWSNKGAKDQANQRNGKIKGSNLRLEGWDGSKSIVKYFKIIFFWKVF